MKVYVDGRFFGQFATRELARAVLVRSEGDLSQVQFEIPKHEALAAIRGYATQARARLAGTKDPVKLAEFADKAALAHRLINHTATDEEQATALNDHWALANGLTEAAEVGRVWHQRAQALRQARNTVNRLEAEALKAVEDAEPLAVEGVLEGLRARAEEALASLLGGE